MKSIRPIHLAMVLSVSLAAACDVVENPAIPTGATLTIPSSETGIVYKDRMEDGKHVVPFSVSNYTLAPAGTCGPEASCGHTQVFLDGSSCVSGGKGPYQTLGAETSTTVDVKSCGEGKFFGSHDVIVQLVKDDDKTQVKNSIGGVVWNQIKITELPTYDGTVKNILAAKCTPCHTGGGQGAHNLGSVYTDAGKAVADPVSDSDVDNSCVTKDKDKKITSRQTVAACALTRVKNGSMPKGAGCTGDPSKDSGNPACLTAAEQNALSAWVGASTPQM